MNKLFYSLCLLLGVVAITSCIKEDKDNCPQGVNTRNVLVRIIGDTTPSVRSTYDLYDTAKISKLDLWINQDGDLKWYRIRNYSQIEIDGEGYVSIPLPEGKRYNFVAVCNYQTDTDLDYPGVMAEGEVAIPSAISAQDNSTFSYFSHPTVLNAYRSCDSLLMSAVVTVDVPKLSDNPADIQVDASLERIVAKIKLLLYDRDLEGDSVKIVTTNTANGYTLSSALQTAASQSVITTALIDSRYFRLTQIVFPTLPEMYSTITVYIKDNGNRDSHPSHYDQIYRIQNIVIRANDYITIFRGYRDYMHRVDLWDYPDI